MKISAIILLFSIFSFAPENQNDGTHAWVDGQWVGKAYQLGYGDWTVSLTVDQNSMIPFTIEYPSLSCGGTWTFEREDRGTLWFRESLDYGKNFCEEGVIIAITRVDEDHISFTCFNPTTKGLSSYSTLERLPNP